MRVRSIIILAAAVATLCAAGPISKFESKQLEADYDARGRLEDIERCLSDMDGWPVPTSYRQPDRPDQTMLLWPKTGPAGGLTAYRIDLRRTATGTHVRSWMPAKQVAECAPKAG